MPYYLPLTVVVLLGLAIAELSASRLARAVGFLAAALAWVGLMAGGRW